MRHRRGGCDTVAARPGRAARAIAVGVVAIGLVAATPVPSPADHLDATHGSSQWHHRQSHSNWRGGDAVRDGTLRLLHHPPPPVRRRGTFDCGPNRTQLPHLLSTRHFQIRYGTIGGGLRAAMYGAALEHAYSVEVTSFGWAKPPVMSGHHLPQGRYPIRIERQALGDYGFTNSVGTWAGPVGDNPATPWREADAEASCMSLRNNFSSSLEMRVTAAHEFVHLIQYGLGVLDVDSEPDDSFIEGTAAWMEGEVVPPVP